MHVKIKLALPKAKHLLFEVMLVINRVHLIHQSLSNNFKTLSLTYRQSSDWLSIFDGNAKCCRIKFVRNKTKGKGDLECNH